MSRVLSVLASDQQVTTVGWLCTCVKYWSCLTAKQYSLEATAGQANNDEPPKYCSQIPIRWKTDMLLFSQFPNVLNALWNLQLVAPYTCTYCKFPFGALFNLLCKNRKVTLGYELNASASKQMKAHQQYIFGATVVHRLLQKDIHNHCFEAAWINASWQLSYR